MDFVDEIKINRVNNVVLVSCSPSTAVATPSATAVDDDLTAVPTHGGQNDAQAWSGRRLEGTLVLTGHHTLVSSNSNDREEIWLLHSNIDTIEIRGPGNTGPNASAGAAAPTTPGQGRSGGRNATSAASRIGAMASAVANQYNLAMNNNAASINNGDAPLFDASVPSAMGVVSTLASAVTVPNYHIVIRCKNLQTLRLSFQAFSEAHKVFESLQKLSNVPSARTHLLYPFFYRSNLDIVEDGWQVFDLEQVII